MSASAPRPLRVGEILDAGIKLYLRNARTLIGLTALVVVPVQVLSAVVLLSTVSTSGQVSSGSGFQVGSRGDTAVTAGRLVLNLLSLVTGALTTAACVKAVSDAYLDNAPDLRLSLRFALRRLGPLIWLNIVYFVLLALAFVLLVIPFFWLYAAASVAVPALMIEGCRGLKAIRRSVRLVRGRWWPTAATVLVVNVMVVIVSAVIGGLLGGIAIAGNSSVVLAVVVASLAGGVASVLARPLQAAVTTVLYYDLRVRHEGYDVVLLAEQLGLPAASLPGGGEASAGPESVGRPGGPPFWPPPPGWTPPALDS